MINPVVSNNDQFFFTNNANRLTISSPKQLFPVNGFDLFSSSVNLHSDVKEFPKTTPSKPAIQNHKIKKCKRNHQLHYTVVAQIASKQAIKLGKKINPTVLPQWLTKETCKYCNKTFATTTNAKTHAKRLHSQAFETEFNCVGKNSFDSILSSRVLIDILLLSTQILSRQRKNAYFGS